MHKGAAFGPRFSYVRICGGGLFGNLAPHTQEGRFPITKVCALCWIQRARFVCWEGHEAYRRESFIQLEPWNRVVKGTSREKLSFFLC